MRHRVNLDAKQAEQALRLLGYSAHTGAPRIGDKAQVARWGLGEDELPEEYRRLLEREPAA